MNRRVPKAVQGAPGKVRIIGGRLRGSKLDVPQRNGLRPTSDRVRETVFNWLQPMLPGARCLDLFAGSGALGMEACSRGASEVVMVERDPELASALRASAVRLGADTIEVSQADALQWLDRARPDAARRFDLVFVDPPFEAALWNGAIGRLHDWTQSGSILYLEAPREQAIEISGWRIHRSGQTRDVAFSLWRRD